MDQYFSSNSEAFSCIERCVNPDSTDPVTKNNALQITSYSVLQQTTRILHRGGGGLGARSQ